MGSKLRSFNPYEVLGVDRNASDQAIPEAFSRRLAADPASSVRIQHAYRILKNPALRKRLNQKLDALIWDTPDPHPEPKPARRKFQFPLWRSAGRR